ncbi:MAG: DUF3240 family protein [Burkholderiaceae bacterium]|nr:DUF3240 family protein [Burkholderiaceae bacterium]
MTERRSYRSSGTSMPSVVLLTLIAAAALEESIADLLLESPELASGFTSSAASGHGADLRFEAASERVRGRGRRVRFELAVEEKAAQALLDRVHEALGDANVYYWICPMIESGTLAARTANGEES